MRDNIGSPGTAEGSDRPGRRFEICCLKNFRGVESRDEGRRVIPVDTVYHSRVLSEIRVSSGLALESNERPHLRASKRTHPPFLLPACVHLW